MPRLISIGQYNVPVYALNYLVNGEEGNLTPEDLNNIDEWIAREFTPHYNNLTFCTAMEENQSFEMNPAFGLACMCEEIEVLGHRKLKTVL